MSTLQRLISSHVHGMFMKPMSNDVLRCAVTSGSDSGTVPSLQAATSVLPGFVLVSPSCLHRSSDWTWGKGRVAGAGPGQLPGQESPSQGHRAEASQTEGKRGACCPPLGWASCFPSS